MTCKHRPYTVVLDHRREELPAVEWVAADNADEAAELAAALYCGKTEYTRDQLYVLLVFAGHHMAESIHGHH